MEKETLKRIYDDATMNPREYYQKYIGKDVYCKDDEQVIIAFVNDLLRRQRNVLENTE